MNNEVTREMKDNRDFHSKVHWHGNVASLSSVQQLKRILRTDFLKRSFTDKEAGGRFDMKQ